MKFTKYLKINMYSPYKYHYLDYKLLSKNINMDTEKYKELINQEITRIRSFINTKIQEIKKSKKKVKKLCKEMKEFAEFVRINVVGFKRILKRKDKKSNTFLYKMYKKELNKILKSVDNLSEIIYKTSKEMTINTTSTNNNLCFVRKTDKYWVHPNNVNSVKFLVLRHLPLYVFNNIYDHKIHDTNISSVYFDNTEYSLYHDRLKKLQNSEAIRIRWYGTDDNIVFIERKRHEDSWTGELSKKLRFKLYETKVYDFITGGNVWEDVKELNGDNEDIKILYDEIQNTIVNKKLIPMVRTCYKRVAFQLPNDSTVRISLDTDLCMIKENFEPTKRSWRRDNIKYLSKNELVKFPYAILEVKTQCAEEDKPEWIINMTNGCLVEHVHKFSKYLHGMSVLYPKINEIPYWLPQMTTKILKDPFEEETGYKEFDNNQVLIDIEASEHNTESTLLNPVDTSNKRISIPVKVEPKVFFANERTFLSWVQFAIFLGGIGTAMLGMEIDKAMVGGVILIGVSIVFAFYALYLYLWRAGMIRRRESGPYDDKYGPPVLVCVFLFAMFLAVIFKFPLKKII
ncbi:vacuolar transporter chaperone 4 (VTC4) [Vairimorpha necatrix]|uniref:Vacuolar transporter chaperone 4 (VTC4) n=1 Tax=Vairimorpha necatrix TaxID=6039 RepID=A0AAX4JC07_9MICR